MRELLLLRHGKSDWSTGGADFDRPLKQRGNKEAKKIGEWLEVQKLAPDWVVSSPAQRARKTAEKVCEILKFKKEDLHFDDRIYEAGAVSLKHVLADCPTDCQRVLLVGHNPGLDGLLLLLADEAAAGEDGKLFATATLARVLLPDDWRDLPDRCGRLVSMTRGAHLH